MTNRRDFIISTAAATGAVGLGLSGCSTEETSVISEAPQSEKKKTALKILILGGTGFIGPHMVRRAQARGHTVTLFNRGKSNKDLFPDVETLIGDRDGQLDALRGGSWNAVIDNSGYIPRLIRDSAELLQSATKQYLFISSISAYANFERVGIDEDYVLASMEDESVEEITGATYGPMKVLGEQAVAAAFPEGTTIVRPGFIVGPGDTTDRWTYWPLRVRRGGEMLVPGTAADPVQFIDARDLAKFVISCVEKRTLGTFNAVGPSKEEQMGPMLATMQSVAGSDVRFTYVDNDTLEVKGARLPIWASPDGEYSGLHRVSNARAVSAGMTFTPLKDTVQDTYEWWDALTDVRRSAMRSGLRIVDEQPDGFSSPPMSLDDQMAAETDLLATLAGRQPKASN